MAMDPNNGEVDSVPMTGLDLYVKTAGGMVTIECGKVMSYNFHEYTITNMLLGGKRKIHVTTTRFPNGFDVFLASRLSLT